MKLPLDRRRAAPGFWRIASGHRDLADVVQLGGARDVLELLARESHLAADLDRELRDLVEVAAELRLALLERLQERGAASGCRRSSAGGASFCAYRRSSAICSAVVASRPSSRDHAPRRKSSDLEARRPARRAPRRASSAASVDALARCRARARRTRRRRAGRRGRRRRRPRRAAGRAAPAARRPSGGRSGRCTA